MLFKINLFYCNNLNTFFRLNIKKGDKNMNRIIILILILLIIFSNIRAQETEYSEPELIIDNIRLPIAPNDYSAKIYSQKDEIANIIWDVVLQLELYEIFIGLEINSKNDNRNDLPKEIFINSESFLGFKDAIILSDVNIMQYGVAPEKDASYFSLKNSVFTRHSKKSNEKYPNNIKTELTVICNIFNLKSQEFIGALDIKTTHTGGSRKKSRNKAFNKFRKKLLIELKKIYLFSSNFKIENNSSITLPLGTDNGVYRGMMFELIEPDRIFVENNEEISIPGGSVALASVTDVAKISSKLHILHKWENFDADCWAVEYLDPIYAVEIFYTPPVSSPYVKFGFNFNARPLQRGDWGLGMQVIQIKDSYNDNSYGFGFCGFAMFRFLKTFKFDFSMKTGCDLDIPFRKDDEESIVNAALFSVYCGLNTEFSITSRTDLVFFLGYRLLGKTSKWKFTEDDVTTNAFWINEAPKINNSGFILSVGYRWLLF